ncbi:hypothetical protein ACNVD4_07970, partial [Rhizobium sp. BR5]
MFIFIFLFVLFSIPGRLGRLWSGAELDLCMTMNIIGLSETKTDKARCHLCVECNANRKITPIAAIAAQFVTNLCAFG